MEKETELWELYFRKYFVTKELTVPSKDLVQIVVRNVHDMQSWGVDCLIISLGYEAHNLHYNTSTDSNSVRCNWILTFLASSHCHLTPLPFLLHPFNLAMSIREKKNSVHLGLKIASVVILILNLHIQKILCMFSIGGKGEIFVTHLLLIFWYWTQVLLKTFLVQDSVHMY